MCVNKDERLPPLDGLHAAYNGAVEICCSGDRASAPIDREEVLNYERHSKIRHPLNTTPNLIMVKLAFNAFVLFDPAAKVLRFEKVQAFWGAYLIADKPPIKF